MRRRAARLWPAAVLLIACAMRPLAAQPSPTDVSLRVGGRDYRVAIARTHGFAATRLSELPFGMLPEVGAGPGGISARVGGKRLRLRAGTPFFRYGDEVVQLVNAPYREAGAVWLPLELFTSWLPTLSLPASGSRDDRPPARPGEGGRDAAKPAGAGSASLAAAAPAPAHRRWRVVIDAGHGGKDPGARNRRTGTREKDITLGVATRLFRRLRASHEVEPILTRDDDRFIPLRDRPRVAIGRDADLFLSIHTNSVRRGNASGFETYYLSEARTERARRVAVRENSAIEYEDAKSRPDLSQLAYILAGLDQGMYVRESSRLAGLVQNDMRRVVPTADRGVKQGPFWVLVGASGSMPAVLVEIGFVTDPQEERRLRSTAGQEKIAGALADAITSYFDEYGRRLEAVGARD